MCNEEEPKAEPSRAELEELVRQKDRDTIVHCQQELDEVLRNYGCSLVPVFQIRGQQIVSYVEIVRRTDA